MSHFSELKGESDVNEIKAPQGCRNDGFFMKTDLYDELGGADRLRSLFYQVLSYFLKGVSVNKDVIKGFPPKLGNGMEADLFTLFWVVRKIGDYELVSKYKLWEFVAKECGLDIAHVGSLKLIYIQYLKELDQWLSCGGFSDTKLENGELGVLMKLDSLFRQCKYASSRVRFENGKGKCVRIESSDDGSIGCGMQFNENLDLATVKIEKGFSRINNVDENDENLGGWDLNVGEKDEEFGGLDLGRVKTEMGFSRINYFNEKDDGFDALDLNIANAEMGFSRINNADEKDEEFGGLDLNIANDEMGFSRINNVDEKDQEFGGFDLNMATTEMGFTRIKDINEKEEEFGDLDLNTADADMGLSRINVDKKVEEFGGLNLDMATTEMWYSVINNVDEKDENLGGWDLNIAYPEIEFSRIDNADEKDDEFSRLDEKRTDLSPDIAVKKVNASSCKDEIEKRVALCPRSAHSFNSGNNEHNNTSENDNNVGSSQKWNKEESLSLSKMLDWVANAAKDPHDVTIGSIPISTKWKKYKSNELWKKVLLVKETLSAKRNVDSGNKVHASQKRRQIMHPSMYENNEIPVHISSKRKRCSQRVSSIKPCSCPGCTSCSSSRSKRHKKSPQIPEAIDVEDEESEDLETEIVNVGAEVPDWTGVASESDPKWLGTRMWPPPDGKMGKLEKDYLTIGKGRQSSCKCSLPGSANCVKVHISENRTKVKNTLGQLFYKWKFNHMGEEAWVSSWTVEEETEFKSLVIKARQELMDKNKSRHEIMSNFWGRASKSIPLKTKDVIVSYYFNVFVLRRRSYQNHIMPEYIDSDDDEQEVVYEKIDALSDKCSKNTQVINLES